ncbi:hypothetical protein BJX64DRAFT_253861 [Aspergillus heterothallicus]
MREISTSTSRVTAYSPQGAEPCGIVYPRPEAFSSTGIGKYYTPKKDRFVRTSGGHKHYLSTPRPRRHFWRSNDRKGLSGKNRLFNRFKSQWMAGK